MRLSLKVRVSLFLMAGVLVSTGTAVGTAAYVQRQRLLEMTESQALSLGETLANGIEAAEGAAELHMVAAARTAASEYVRKPLTNGDLMALSKVLETEAVYVANQDGVFTAASDTGSVGFNLYSVAPTYKDLVTGKAKVLAEPIKLRAEDGKTAKFLAVPLPDGKGFAEVALTVDAVRSLAKDTLDQEPMLQRVQLVAADLKGLLDETRSGAGDTQGKDVTDPLIKQTLEAGTNQTVTTGTTVSAYIPVHKTDLETGKEQAVYVLRLDMSEAEALAAIQAVALRTGLGALGLAVLIGIVIYFFLDRALRPIKPLVAAARRAATGDLSSGVKIKGTPELEELGGALNGLIDGLRSSMESLGKTSETIAAASRHMEESVSEAGRVAASVDLAASRMDQGSQAQVQQAIGSMESFHSAVEQLATAATSQAEQVQQSSLAVNHMVQAAETVSTRATRVSSAAAALAERARPVAPSSARRCRRWPPSRSR